jgi:aspartyl-tRNA(Asn)/glutamyl-tRNA(Gln) amidotransferase subunit B
MEWETVIGIETHAQLSTRSKMFSGAPTTFGAAPNTQASAVDIALPGVLPVANRGAVERAIRFGLAVGGTIGRTSVFARKNYFYPDLPKGYQISQFEAPIVQGGGIAILTKSGERTIPLTRAHLEEDAGKSLHEDFHGMSGIDLNRAGTPLLEIVSEPDLHSAEEAVAYARALHSLVRWIDICDGNMQEGSFRCDANVSVRPRGETKLGTRCEIKNLNSFRFLERAIEYEARRQVEVLEGGGRIVQETRLYDPDRDETRSMRTKEEAHDYRYFPDPDLLPLVVSDQWIEEIRARMPELPQARRNRFISAYSMTQEQARLLTGSREMADYYEAVVKHLEQIVPAEVLERKLVRSDEKGSAAESTLSDVARARFRLATNWVVGELSAALNKAGVDIAFSRVSPQQLAVLLARELDQTISGKLAKEVFDAMWAADEHPGNRSVSELADRIIQERGLEQISDVSVLDAIVAQVLAANPRQVEDFRAGREKAFNSLVGQVMKATRGKANPAQVNELLRKKLAG